MLGPTVHAVWDGFCQGLGFCLAVSLTVGYSELKAFAVKAYDSNILGAYKRWKASRPVAPVVAPAPAPVPYVALVAPVEVAPVVAPVAPVEPSTTVQQ